VQVNPPFSATEEMIGHSLRRRLLSDLAPELQKLGLSAPARLHFDWSCISAASTGNREELNEIITEAKRNTLLGNRLFAQACPHDEGLRPDLSFAGAFRTYHPRRRLSQAENIADGLSYVISGRHNRYADIYYRRHHIFGERAVDIKFANYIDRIIAIGTAYVYGDRCLLQYFDSYLSLYVNDAVRIYADRATLTREARSWENRLPRAFLGVGEMLNIPVDIEFVITAEDVVHVTQVRPISPPHLRLWETVEDEVWARVRRSGPPSITLNSIGRFEGPLVDLRHRMPTDKDALSPGSIYVIWHQEAGPTGTGALSFLEWAGTQNPFGFGLIVDHGESRRNDHLDYILTEDPEAVFVASATALPAAFDTPGLTLESDGFELQWH